MIQPISSHISTQPTCDARLPGEGKQTKRYDLRQVGLAMVVTRNDMIPLFHHTYQGNLADAKVFSTVLETIRDRMNGLGFDSSTHTMVLIVETIPGTIWLW
ncbi:MAG: hypothetical protein HS132_08780 [Planctomycetia bacterium]|nr:hypothetical protein [Planctomycetia bacterium]